ncbi:VOC family protein [Streptomyces tailanensis]|uniref:VOC family protein n=1 Tax=Streptomyces tailanensis TaxID=2569858 RepID=UPI00122E0680|nr:hypothetical protein [Streptomyces tailanensis]
MSTSLTRRTALTAGLALGASLAVANSTAAQAATRHTADATDSAGVTRLQWTGLGVTSEQYTVMKEFTEKALDLTLITSADEFAVFRTPNSSLFELYGPKAPHYGPWHTSAMAMAIGFDAPSLEAAESALERVGAPTASDILVFPGAGGGGTDYRARFFLAPDNRFYGVAQSNIPNDPVPESATGAAGINRLQWGAVAVTAHQHAKMRTFAQQGLGLDIVDETPQFSAFGAQNGSMFELYGPEAPQYPWRTRSTSIAMGFNTIDLHKSMAHLEQNGAKWVSPVHVIPGAGGDGTDYRFRFFRAPDNRVYSIAQSNITG